MVDCPHGREVRELFGSAFDGICHFAQMLADEGELRGLVGPREIERLWPRHLVNSAAVAGFLPGAEDAGSLVSGAVGEIELKGQTRPIIADVGSGAGFPGIVLAIMRPDLQFDLVETMGRRCEWLEDVVAEMGIANVTVRQCRAEELHGKREYDVVTARAVANMKKLAGYCVPLLKPGGRLLALKGARAVDELQEAAGVLAKLGCGKGQVHMVESPYPGEATVVVEVSRKA